MNADLCYQSIFDAERRLDMIMLHATADSNVAELGDKNPVTDFSQDSQ
jgi:hypothetical protein